MSSLSSFSYFYCFRIVKSIIFSHTPVLVWPIFRTSYPPSISEIWLLEDVWPKFGTTSPPNRTLIIGSFSASHQISKLYLLTYISTCYHYLPNDYNSTTQIITPFIFRFYERHLILYTLQFSLPYLSLSLSPYPSYYLWYIVTYSLPPSRPSSLSIITFRSSPFSLSLSFIIIFFVFSSLPFLFSVFSKVHCKYQGFYT